MWIFLAHLLLFFLGGLVAGRWMGASWTEAVRFGMSLLIWGGIFRTLVFSSVVWSVNAFGHCWGYRNFETRDNSRNNVLLGFLCHGDGWHNNHHAHQRWARHGLKWWELDTAYLTIRVLQRLGVTWNVLGANDNGPADLHDRRRSQTGK
jgi:stearoyl-CoA desaturase (delta-9 desaturase)